MDDELIDIYNENNRPLGYAQAKSEAHRDGLWHQVAFAWIYDPTGRVLLQLRSKTRRVHPNTWDTSSSGHVRAGEDPVDAIVREVKEELGLTLSKGELNGPIVLRSPKSHDGLIDNEFMNVFFIQRDLSLYDLEIDKEEVETVRFVPIETLAKEFQESPERFCSSDRQYWETSIAELKRRLHYDIDRDPHTITV